MNSWNTENGHAHDESKIWRQERDVQARRKRCIEPDKEMEANSLKFPAITKLDLSMSPSTCSLSTSIHRITLLPSPYLQPHLIPVPTSLI